MNMHGAERRSRGVSFRRDISHLNLQGQRVCDTATTQASIAVTFHDASSLANVSNAGASANPISRSTVPRIRYHFPSKITSTTLSRVYTSIRLHFPY